MELEQLEEWVPYNEFIGDPDSTDTHLVHVVEEWKEVPGYEGYYMASSFGRVHSVDRAIVQTGKKTHPRYVKGVLLVQKINEAGYSTVYFCRDGVRKNLLAHRIIAITFIENEHNRPQVNHKKGLKTKNRRWLLEWATPAENIQHAHKTGLMHNRGPFKGESGNVHPLGKKVYAYDINGKLIGIYNSTRHVANVFNIRQMAVSDYCRGKRINTQGYKFSYTQLH